MNPHGPRTPNTPRRCITHASFRWQFFLMLLSLRLSNHWPRSSPRPSLMLIISTHSPPSQKPEDLYSVFPSQCLILSHPSPPLFRLMFVVQNHNLSADPVNCEDQSSLSSRSLSFFSPFFQCTVTWLLLLEAQDGDFFLAHIISFLT